MPVFVVCSNCHNVYSINKKECPKCGFKEKQNKKFLVRVEHQGRKVSEVVHNSLDLARNIERKLKTELIENTYFQNSSMTFDEAFNRYIELYPSKHSQHEINRYANHIRKTFGARVVGDITSYDIQSLISYKAQTLSAKTVHHIYNLIHRTFVFCYNNNFIQQNPCKNIRLPRVNNEITHYLDKEQIKKLLEVLVQDKNKESANLIKFLLFTGIRRGEAFKLTWSDIDFNTNSMILRDPKSGKDKQLPLNSLALAVLQDQLKYKRCELVFPQANCKMRTTVFTFFERVKKAAGISSDFRVHDLRHTYASLLASSGKVDIYTLQHLLTHSSISMTKRYAHLLDERMRDSAEVMADLIKD